MIDLNLTSNGYSRAVTLMRQTEMATPGTEYSIRFVEHDRTFFYRKMNFFLFRYQIRREAPQNIVHYQHLFPATPIDFARILVAAEANNYNNQGGNIDLTIIISLTSEAARSAVVYRKFQQLISNKRATMDLSLYGLLFHNYNHVGRFVGYLNSDGSYTSRWKPLEKDDYYRYFVSSEFTGDKEQALRILRDL